MYSKWIYIITLISLTMLWDLSASAVNWPLKISAKGKYLEDQNGLPFLIVGDTAWSLAGELNQAEVVTYLDDRQSKGITAIIVSVIESTFSSNPPYNYDNEHPFTNGSNDWSARNEKYWAHIDYILNEAKNRNIVVFLAPAYIGYHCGSDGWAQYMLAQATTTMKDYGEFLGNRYKDQGNIIWMHGGDEDCDYCSICDHVTNIHNGIVTHDKNHLHTAHSLLSRSAMDDYNAISDINTAYSYGSPDSEIQAEYSRTGAKPLVFIEGLYENEHSSTIGMWQSQAMTAYLGGALIGQFFGNCPIWPFGVPNSYCSLTNWEENLDSNGSKSIGNIGQLMRSRKWYELEPDYSNNVVTSSKGTGLEYHATASTTNGETLMVWCPNTNEVTVDMSKITDAESLAKSWWYNPDDNSATVIGTFENKGTRNFTPPSTRLVLVIDSNSAALPAPGSAPDEIIGTWSGGIWYWDVAASKWTRMTSSNTTGDITAGDFTGDGKADVASVWPSGLWYQDGATLSWTTVGKAPDRVTAGDVTGDGRSEIIGTWSGGIWYWDVAASKWTRMTSSNTTGDITAGDFTGDGKADVASVWPSGLWYQDGATLGWTKVPGSAPGRVTAGDVTGDGRDEIIATWDSGLFYWDVVASKYTKMDSAPPTGDIAAGDFTGDGIADVAAIYDSGLWYIDGASFVWTNVGSSPPIHVTAGDVSGK